MALAYFNPYPHDQDEPILSEVKFKVHKFNHRLRPKQRDRIKIISCFSEFGCETIGCMYCIPKMIKRFPGAYVVAMGWYGREYLYRHLVDEFWEVDESYMWLRDYTRAFHHLSKNLDALERAATAYGNVIPSATLGKYLIGNLCRTCGKFWTEWKAMSKCCPVCQSTVIFNSLLTDTAACKKEAVKIPRPSQEHQAWAKSILKPNSVGIFARARKTYGRNLDANFYVNLINLLESMGYNVIWLGEKQNTLPCPVDHIVDFSRLPESRDLSRTLAIISQLKFTIQFWTASTRLAAIMGVPYILFESPEQIYASLSGMMAAQEGKRLELCTYGPRKIVISHYHNVVADQETTLQHVRKAIDELNMGDYSDMIGLVEDKEFIRMLQKEHQAMLT